MERSSSAASGSGRPRRTTETVAGWKVVEGDRLIAIHARAWSQRREILHHPPPREVCALLAAGLLRLRGREAEDLARDALHARDLGESSLHKLPSQSGHADPI